MKPIIINAPFQNWFRTLLAIFFAALLICGAFVLTLQDSFYFPDSITYFGAAINLLTHGELGGTTDIRYFSLESTRPLEKAFSQYA
jgi:hypothetical protein